MRASDFLRLSGKWNVYNSSLHCIAGSNHDFKFCAAAAAAAATVPRNGLFYRPTVLEGTASLQIDPETLAPEHAKEKKCTCFANLS